MPQPALYLKPNVAVEPLDTFWPAEPYHREYYRRNPNQGYCRAVIAPKVAKLRKQFFDRLKDESRGAGPP